MDDTSEGDRSARGLGDWAKVFGAAAIAALVLFPPWHMPQTGQSVGHHPLWATPTRQWITTTPFADALDPMSGYSTIPAEVDVTLLAVQIGAVLAVVALVVMFDRRKPSE